MHIEIGQYLNRRLMELGINHLFGVAGDFNLSYLEQIIETDSLQFIGNCNELNAAYAADGYARSNGFSALVTTYGVGDLSAINGVAGAYAENVPIVHISGTPPLHAMNSGKLLHHTLIDGNYNNIMNCMREFTVAQARLTPENAAAEIDRVLQHCFLTRRPVYIQLPSDITHVKIAAINAPLQLDYPQGDPALLEQAIKQLVVSISTAKHPLFLIDNEAHIFSVSELLLQLATDYNIPYVSLTTSKHVMDESSALYAGVYLGQGSDPLIRELVEESDCLIGIGVRFTDAATGFFTHNIQQQHFINIKQYDLNLAGENYPGLEIRSLLTSLHKALADKGSFSEHNGELEKMPAFLDSVPKALLSKECLSHNPLSHNTLTHNILWQMIAQFLREDDVIIGEVGTSNSGLSSILLPKSADYISQPLWGSIGYTLPGLLGSMFAAPSRRHLLFIGDGSLQLTAQELSTIVRHELKPIIFVLNNGGYTIERLILGEKAVYNDIQNWQYTEIIPIFNGKGDYQRFVVETPSQLEETLQAVNRGDALTLIELRLDPMDAPESLKQFGDVVARYDYGEAAYQQLKGNESVGKG